MHRDHLGTILAISNSLGDVVEKRLFDAWGDIAKVQNGAGVALTRLTFIDRGYTGHEHLQSFKLINMNGRLYDPRLHRFLQPDNNLQEPYNTQNYNRYGYVLNNPLAYTDPTGEFWWSIVTAVVETVVNVFTHGVNVHNYDYQKTNMAWNIDKGLLQGNFGQILNRFTWGLGQTFVGNLISHGYNWAGNVEGVTYLDGATAIETNRDGDGAFSMGGYINGPKGFKADWKDHLFVHEYGHYIQGQWLGPLYIPVVATTSILSAAGLGGNEHESRWFEVQASRMGGKHFDDKYGSGAAGYVQGSANYFDYTSYKKGGITPYDNPRYLLYPAKYTNGALVPVNQQKGHQTSGARFSIWDIIVPVSPFVSALSLGISKIKK